MDLVIHQEKLFPMKDVFQVIIILIAANSRARERGKKRREVKGEEEEGGEGRVCKNWKGEGGEGSADIWCTPVYRIV